jgi:hypothetical protein
VDPGKGKPLISVFSGTDGLPDGKLIDPQRFFRSAATPSTLLLL